MPTQDLLSLIDHWLAQRVHRSETPGVVNLIVERGETVTLSSHGLASVKTKSPITDTTSFPVASLTKPFICATLLMLQAEGVVDLDDSVDQHLESRLGNPDILIRHLLSHTAGLSSSGGGRVGLDYLLHPPSDTSGAIVRPPNTKAVYSNYGYALAGEIIEAVTKTTLEAALRERIFEPLGMVGTGFFANIDATGYLYRDASGKRAAAPGDPRDYTWAAAGDLISTPADLARWAAALTTDEFLPKPIKQEWLRSQWTAEDGQRWALGWLLTDVGGRDIASQGGHLLGFHHGMLFDPERQRVIIVLTNTVDADGEVWADMVFSGLELEIAEEATQLERFAGRYGSAWGDFAIIPIDGETLLSISLDGSGGLLECDTLTRTSDSELQITGGTAWSPLDEKVLFSFNDQQEPIFVAYGSDEVRFLGRL